jgi:hypothetical protein
LNGYSGVLYRNEKEKEQFSIYSGFILGQRKGQVLRKQSSAFFTLFAHLIMGIYKLWAVLSAGEKKLTLEELSHETYQKRGTGLRVAIDIALWAFQSRSSVVGE